MPKRFGWLGRPVRRLNEKLVRRFDSCWIPDFPNTHALAGALADPGTGRLKNNVQHIGWLSRFKPRQEAAVKYDVTAVLSGPEPQRTLLESTVLPQLQSSGLRYRVVRGLPSIATTPADNNVVNFLASGELQECIEASAVIIARSGYSTVMDMHALGKSVIFIPTPGQTEQEYLARRLKSKGIAFYMKQEEFDLTTALLEYKRYSGFTTLRSENLLRETVSSILKPNPEFDR